MIQFFGANWLWIAFLVVFVAMHRGGHGCGMHGSHAGHAGHRADTGEHTDHSHHSGPRERADSDRSTP